MLDLPAEGAAVYLAQMGHGKLVDEDDLARVLVRLEPRQDVLFQS
jgi:hypothetical protein